MPHSHPNARVRILAAPLPPGPDAGLAALREALADRLAPFLDAAQRAHVRGYAASGAPLRAALSRLLARALLLRAVARATGLPPPALGMDALGRPFLPGWEAAFSHSGLAAFCALRPASASGELGGLALDAESVGAAMPAPRAFAPAERAALRAVPAGNARRRESLRRWIAKEALLKAAGLGLRGDPDAVSPGRLGQCAGVWRGPDGRAWQWRRLACPGHWLCLAWSGGDAAAHVRWGGIA